VAPLGGGAQRRGEEEDDNAQAATDSQSATESHVQGFFVAANQQVRRCKQVPFRLMACPAARPRSFKPSCRPVISLRFSSFLVVSRRFSSFLVVSRRFSSLLGRSASGPHQMRAPRPRSCARQARSRQNRLGDMHRNMSAVHLVQPSNLFESCSDQIARGRAAHA